MVGTNHDLEATMRSFEIVAINEEIMERVLSFHRCHRINCQMQ
jgi:hypothetical protein